MAGRDDDSFRIKPGRSRRQGPRANVRDLPFLTQVKIAARKAGGGSWIDGGGMGREGSGSGRFNARGRGAKLAASFPRDGGGWRRDSVGRFRSRRVVVKARVVRFAGKRKGARGPNRRGVSAGSAVAHLRYLERDGVTCDGDKGRAYSAFEDEADGKAFLDRSREDRHQFRFIVAPEDAAELDNLKGFTRDLMRQMEQDLGTQLDWVAVDHHNTGHPHTHILVRGALDDGRILNIAGDYIAYGVRHRASELMTLELGPQTEIELHEKLRHEVEAERLPKAAALSGTVRASPFFVFGRCAVRAFRSTLDHVRLNSSPLRMPVAMANRIMSVSSLWRVFRSPPASFSASSVVSLRVRGLALGGLLTASMGLRGSGTPQSFRATSKQCPKMPSSRLTDGLVTTLRRSSRYRARML